MYNTCQGRRAVSWILIVSFLILQIFPIPGYSEELMMEMGGHSQPVVTIDVQNPPQAPPLDPQPGFSEFGPLSPVEPLYNFSSAGLLESKYSSEDGRQAEYHYTYVQTPRGMKNDSIYSKISYEKIIGNDSMLVTQEEKIFKSYDEEGRYAGNYRLLKTTRTLDQITRITYEGSYNLLDRSNRKRTYAAVNERADLSMLFENMSGFENYTQLDAYLYTKSEAYYENTNLYHLLYTVEYAKDVPSNEFSPRLVKYPNNSVFIVKNNPDVLGGETDDIPFTIGQRITLADGSIYEVRFGAAYLGPQWVNGVQQADFAGYGLIFYEVKNGSPRLRKPLVVNYPDSQEVVLKNKTYYIEINDGIINLIDKVESARKWQELKSALEEKVAEAETVIASMEIPKNPITPEDFEDARNVLRQAVATIEDLYRANQNQISYRFNEEIRTFNEQLNRRLFSLRNNILNSGPRFLISGEAGVYDVDIDLLAQTLSDALRTAMGGTVFYEGPGAFDFDHHLEGVDREDVEGLLSYGDLRDLESVDSCAASGIVTPRPGMVIGCKELGPPSADYILVEIRKLVIRLVQKFESRIFENGILNANSFYQAVLGYPFAETTNFEGNEDSTVAGSVRAISPGGHTLTYQIVQGPSHGDLTLNEDGVFIYTPNANYNGEDSFTYKATDGTRESNVAQITLQLASVNDAPSFDNPEPETFEFDHSVTEVFELSAGDVDSDRLTFEIIEGNQPFATLIDNGDGTAFLQLFHEEVEDQEEIVYEMTIRVRDANGMYSDKAYRLVCLCTEHPEPQVHPTDLSVLAEAGKYTNDALLFTADFIKTDGYSISGFGDKIGPVIWNKIFTENTEYGGKKPELVRFFDADGDGIQDEIVFARAYQIYAYNPDGSLIWSISGTDKAPYTQRTMEIFDADNDGIDDILIYGGHQGHMFFVLNGEDGSEKWSDVPGGNSLYGQEGIIGDFDGDGLRDDFAVTYSEYYGDERPFVKVYTTNDGNSWTLAWNNTTELHRQVWEIDSIDLTGDGVDDVVLQSSEHGLKALNGVNGQLLWSVPVLVNGGSGVQSFVAIDADHDGKRQEFVTAGKSNILWIDKNGNVLRTVSTPTFFNYEIEVMDVDGDGFEDDVVVPHSVYGGKTYLTAYDEQGNMLWDKEVPEADGNHVGSLWIDDLNGDGFAEIIFGSDGSKKVYVYNNNGELQWDYTLPASIAGRFGKHPSLRTADINGDGFKEIAVAAGDDSPNSYLYFIQNVSVVATFSDGTTSPMKWNESTQQWEFSRSFTTAGVYSWEVRAQKDGYETAIAAGQFEVIADPNPPVIILDGPPDHHIETFDRTPDFKFSASDQEIQNLTVELWMDDGTGEKLVVTASGASGDSFVLTPEKWLADGTYEWWIRTTDGNHTTNTPKRILTINNPYYPKGDIDISLWPSWAFNEPLNTIHLYGGEDLHAKMKTLKPGDKLIVHEGTYSYSGWYKLELKGTAEHPIFIEGAAGENVVITRPDVSQNNFNIDNSEYLAFRNLKFIGGSSGIRIGEANNIIFEDNEVAYTDGNAITANQENASYLYFMRNHIHDTGGHGEGFYIGAHDGSSIVHHSVIYNNWVHDLCVRACIQGDGIEIKQGSYANLIKDNIVYNTPYPGIIVYGTEGMEPNVIEGNFVMNSGDNGIQARSGVRIRNNIIVNSTNAGINVRDGSEPVRDVEILNNIIVNASQGLYFLHPANTWENVIIANNVIYNPGGVAIQGVTGGTVQGNVVLGTFPPQIASGVTLGNSIEEDFINAAEYNFYPKNELFAGRSQLSGHLVLEDYAHQEQGDILYAGVFEKINDVGNPIQLGFKYRSRLDDDTPIQPGWRNTAE